MVFFSQGSISGKLFGGLWAPRGSMGAVSEFRGGSRGPKRAPYALQRGSRRGPWSPERSKSENRDALVRSESDLKTIEKPLVFVVFSAMRASGGGPTRRFGHIRGVDEVLVAAVYVRRSLGRAIVRFKVAPGTSLGASGSDPGRLGAARGGSGDPPGTSPGFAGRRRTQPGGMRRARRRVGEVNLPGNGGTGLYTLTRQYPLGTAD